MQSKPEPASPWAIFLALFLPLSLLLTGDLRWHASAATHQLRVTVIDVGEGDCILIQTPSDRTMLIDGGGTRVYGKSENESAESPVGEKTVVPALRRAGVTRIDILVITHPHNDHIGGLFAVLREFRVNEVLDGTTLDYPSNVYKRLLKILGQDHIQHIPARRGEQIDFGDGVHADILNPPTNNLVYGTDFGDKTINNYSAVIRLNYRNEVYLFDGDAEQEAEDNILSTYPIAYLHADLLKAGHHGSRNASSEEWLNAVRPKVAILCCGKNNLFGHPHRQTLQKLSQHHIQILRTDQDGSAEFDSDGTNLIERRL